MNDNQKPKRLQTTPPMSRRHYYRTTSFLSLESLEAKLPLDASGFIGNACAPNLDLSAITVQSTRVNEELVLDLYAAGATVTDVDANGTATGDTIRLQLDPDDGPANATLTSDGVFRWTPTLDQIGRFEFVVIAVDAGDPPLADAELLVVEVRANEAPNLAAVSDASAAVNQELEVQLTATDPEGDGLTFLLDPDQAPVTGATLEQVDNNTAVLRWTPTAADAGQSRLFSVLVVDDGFPPLSDNEMFTVNVMTVGAADDTFRALADQPFTTNVGNGVLANDVDSDGDALTASIISQPMHGSLSLAADGTFTYTPDTGFRGPDSFTYQAQDGSGDVSIASVTLNVNSPPIAVDDNYTTSDVATLTIDMALGVLANDTDADGDLLTAMILQAPQQGQLTLNENGSFAYTPETAATGPVTFTYLVSDGLAESSAATVTITVDAVNDAPVAVADDYEIAEDQQLTIGSDAGVLVNDTDQEGDMLTAALVDEPSHGSVELTPAGAFVYSPNANFNGSDSFSYTASDGELTSNTTVVTIEVLPANDAPVANPDSYAATVAVELSVNAANGVLANDVDLDGDQLSVQVVSSTANGQLTLNPNGSFTYTSNAGFSGTDSFTYAITDGEFTSEAVTQLTVGEAVNRPPIGTGDTYTAIEDQVLVVETAAGVLANDSDPDDDPLTAILVGEPGQGTLTFNADGSFEYTADQNSTGLDGFSYRVSDGTLTSDEVLVVFMVTTSNDAPVAMADAYEVTVGEVLNVTVGAGVLANDTDVDSQNFTASLVSAASNGTVTLQPDGSFTYTPAADFIGTDTFTYQASDGTAASASATVNIVVNPNNLFTVASGVETGSAVGTVLASRQATSPVVYEFTDGNANPELMLNADDHLSGDPTASAVLIEYLDFQCPVCATFHPMVLQLQADFAGDLLVVRRHFPLESVHQNARAAARAAEAAGRQDKFEEMGDLLFGTQEAWQFATNPQQFFETYASVLGLDLEQFRSDMADPAVDARISRDLAAVIDLGATGTPTFFLNRNQIAIPGNVAEFANLVQNELDLADAAFAINRLTGEILVADGTLLDFADDPSITLPATVTLPVTITDVEGNSESVDVTIQVIDAASGEPPAAAIDDVVTEEWSWLNVELGV